MTSFTLLALLLCGCLTGSFASDGSVCFHNQELQVLDQSIKHFRCHINETIHALNCSGRGVPALPGSSDEAVPQEIQIFDFSNNYIKCLPKIMNPRPTCNIDNCHSGCLVELRLQNNEIDFLHEEVFLNLTCLQKLDLSNNHITNKTLKKHHFFRLSHLHYFDLHGNPLHTLPNNVLISTHMAHLHTLNLSSCQLEKIGELAIDDFFEMEVVDLSRNKLTALSGRTFQGLTALKILDLRWNKLKVLENNTFIDLRELRELRLGYNSLHHISDLAFHNLASFPRLDLSYNLFSDIPILALSTLKKLQVLDMSHNPVISLKPGEVFTAVQDLKLDNLHSLTSVMNRAFTAFPRLSKLSLRFCDHLTTIPRKAFSGRTQKLTEVKLDHNALTSLPEDLLPWEQLSLLTLHGNPWHCDCSMGWAADHPVGNTTLHCEEPLKLRGQELKTLQQDELNCPKNLIGMKAVIGFFLTLTIILILVLIVYHRKRRTQCWCLWSSKGQYVTVFTKSKRGTSEDDDEEGYDGSCAEADVDDLDLGNGEGPSSEGGRVMILLNTFRNGYKRLKNKDGESSQDLTLSEV